MNTKEKSYGFQYHGYKRSSGLSSNKRTNCLQAGSKQKVASNKDSSWKVKKDHIDQMFDQVLNEKINQFSLKKSPQKWGFFCTK